MRKIKEYKVLSDESNSLFSSEHFSKKINDWIAKGWQPLSGLSVSQNRLSKIPPYYKYTFHQAIVLFED